MNKQNPQTLDELIEKWKNEGIPIHPQNPHPSETAGEKAANQLEEIINNE